jgi:hypothetical protein
MTISFILRPLEIFYGHLVYFVVIVYNFPRFGILDQEKSGNPGVRTWMERIKKRGVDFCLFKGDMYVEIGRETSKKLKKVI